LLSIPGVTAVDLGYKIRDHKFTDELALRVHVEQKLPPEVFDTRPRELILKETEEPKHPEQRYLDSNGTRVPMDVIEADYKLVQIGEAPRRGAVLEKPLENGEVNRRRRLDPLVGGVSIGSPQTPAGTLGALVWDREDGSICILSNWHVLAGDLRAEVGNPCFQPGLFDQGRSTDVVARLKRWSFNRKTDAAIAELTGSRRYSTGEILDMFQTIKGVADHLYLGMTVHKSGRSSSHSWGFIDGLYFSSAIAYSNGVVRVFEEQIHIAPLTGYSISEPGDSGSVWVTNASDEGYLAVGLHFAGDLPHSSFGEYALANPMSVVARRLNFSFRPLFLEIRDEPMTPPQPPPFAQPVKIQLGNAAQPMSIVLNGLTRSGPEPEDDKMGAGG
jgi:endonuclease G